MELLLFNKTLVEYLEQCKRYNIKPILCIITNGNKKHFIPFDYVQIIPIGKTHIYFINKNKRMFEIILEDVINCKYVEFGFFFSAYLK